MRAIALLALALGGVPREARTQDLAYDNQLEARVWVDRGNEPVLDRGDRVRVYYRTSEPAYVAIFRIDTDGVVSLLFPQHPDADTFVLGGRDFRLLFPRSPEWRVEDPPGVGYFFIVASQEPLDLSTFPFDRVDGWDLSSVGEVVYEDPYLAMDDFVARLLPDWEVSPYTLDFITYNVGDTHTYPRFLCYDCHGYQSYARWNPYAYSCPTYQIVIWDDPYFYPAYRYSGTRVVYAAPIRNRPRYGVTARVAGSGWAPLVRVREAPSLGTEFKEPATARRVAPPTAARRGAAPATSGRAVPTRQTAPNRVVQPGTSSGRPTLRRRPSSAVRGGTGARSPAGGARQPPAEGSRTRAVLPSRPGTRAAPSSARPSTSPSERSRPTSTRPSTRSPSSRQPASGTARPSPPRPTTQPRAGTARPSARPPTQRPSARPSTPSGPPTRAVRPSRPDASSGKPSTGSRPARPTVRPRPPPRRPGG